MTEPRPQTGLDRIAESWLDTQLDLAPELRVMIGRPGREGEYADYSPAGEAAAAEAAQAALAQAREATPVDDVDVVTKLELVRELELRLESYQAGLWQRDLNNISSPLQGIRDVFDLSPRAALADWEVIARRLGNVPAAVRGYTESLRYGMTHGNVPAIRQVTVGIAQADELQAPTGFFGTLARDAALDGVELPESLQAELDKNAKAAQAAYGDLSYFLDDELAHLAPAADGVGRELYQLASRSFVGATLDLDETYEWGIDELRRMREEMERTAGEITPGATVAEAIAFLKADESRNLHGTDALKAWMQGKSDEALRELGATHFDIPRELYALECMIAPTQHGGIYYTAPTDDFSRPGQMWWSVPPGVETFQTWSELTTVYHEGVPGHHLQLGMGVYNKAQLNAWRRTQFISGHGEGWALYAERLMEQLGFLKDPAERLGMLDGQRMRATRVVLDIGVHLGKRRPDGQGVWTGDYAYEFFAENVLDGDGPTGRFEVTRYLGWPGQAPSYKVGQRFWEDLRDEVKRREGAAFDIKAFHKKALDLGGVGLDTLRVAMLG
ncbi:DUF885 domain-containing protein [Gryllotalpicola sp.]|uniref:DUF885 domain-containing protein n=1 Tax=Gryllotalpicola sp. TaxID=1932787 RepID=UPI00261E49D5|nr:DUF885 domain-containing protein [Gryllotalpicola sp.]